jgi:hypothetical protein
MNARLLSEITTRHLPTSSAASVLIALVARLKHVLQAIKRIPRDGPATHKARDESGGTE